MDSVLSSWALRICEKNIFYYLLSFAIYQLACVRYGSKSGSLETRCVCVGGAGRWRMEPCSLWHRAFQKVRDQPGGPVQLTAAVIPSLMRIVVVLETVSGEDSRKESGVGNGMEISVGTGVIIRHSFSSCHHFDNASHMGLGGRGPRVGKRRDLVRGRHYFNWSFACVDPPLTFSTLLPPGFLCFDLTWRTLVPLGTIKALTLRDGETVNKHQFGGEWNV